MSTQESPSGFPLWSVTTESGTRIPVGGYVAKGYEPVLAVFEQNLRSGKEIGAACAAYVHGQCVVDLWGGWRIPGSQEAWQHDTLALVMSTTKGLAAMALAIAQSQGLFDYEEPVAKYWPEFGKNGKADITIRHLLAHQAGLSVLDGAAITRDLLSNRDALAKVLEGQKPAWKPGTRYGYHATSLGYFQNELIRRTDPKHRSIGQFFHEEIAMPMGGDMYIGLPENVADARLAMIKTAPDWKAMRELPLSTLLAVFNPFSLFARTGRSLKIRKLEELMSREWLSLELPSYGGVVTARAVAKTYSTFAGGAKQLGLNDKTFQQLQAPSVVPSNGINDAVLGVPVAYSLGFAKPYPRFSFGSDNRAFGTPGAGGSQGIADPGTGLGFAYTPNQLMMGGVDDPRAMALREETYKCIGAMGNRHDR